MEEIMKQILVNKETFDKRISYNVEQVKAITYSNYPHLDAYFRDKRHRRSSLYVTYREINDFLRNKVDNPLYINGRYVFFLDSGTLTKKVRKKDKRSRSTSNRHINLLSAIGYFPKCKEAPDILAEYKQKNKLRRTINAFYMPKLTDEYLQKCEQTAAGLQASGITSGNVSYNQLMLNEQADRGNETYLHNNRRAPDRKEAEAETLFMLMDTVIADKGYCSKSDIEEQLPDVSPKELEKLYRIFKRHLQERYSYKCPTKAQMKLYNLPDRKYIFTVKEQK